MDSPPEAGSTRLTDADSVSEGAVEPIPVFAEKSRLMGTSRVTEEAGIDELRNSHLTLEESSPPWIFRNLQIYALKTTDNDPVLLAIVASLHHKTQSAFGDNTLEALQLAATLWPISFAAVVGPFLKTLALFRAERGAALGSDVIRQPAGGGSSVLELGPQFKGPVAYSAKMFSSSRLKIKEGPYESGKQPSTISFNGFESKFRETSMFMEGASWPFEVDVNGQTQTWQWRRKKAESSSTIKRFFGSMSQSKLGSWELIPASGQGAPAASLEAAGGSTSEPDSALGEFMFYGPASVGQVGDIFMNVSIAVLLRIISQHYISRIAASAG
ncbi:hypothetical protein FLAG1_10426 [Fusarium langsethiae]|uniref:Uncharacterized protein n=1 Tax=Fusarium langsethiae TaxID=179993 RepID=A0A0M9ENR0_FUSLA|nr:hypothetical protein FLAG1_10426 [Fusarium langsethiae]